MPKSKASKDSEVAPVRNDSGGTKVAAAGFDSRLIPEFDGEKTGAGIVEWFTRAEVLCKHNEADLALVLPAGLTGGAYAVWL